MLVDTSVWTDHLRRGNSELAARLEVADVWCHPFVIGELACGNLANRTEILSLLQALPQAPLAHNDEVLTLVDARQLMGRGLGWVDVHLLASALLAGVPFWTHDRRLGAVAGELGVSPP